VEKKKRAAIAFQCDRGVSDIEFNITSQPECGVIQNAARPKIKGAA
jgi:hypothetical protein